MDYAIALSSAFGEAQAKRPPQSPTRLALGRLRRSTSAMIGLTMLTFLIALALLAPIIAPSDPTEMSATEALQPPSTNHLFGTDQFGRDILSRVLYGSRLSLPLGVMPVAIALVLGVSMGLVAGNEKGWMGTIIMRATDVMLGFPMLLLALFIVAMLGASLTNAMIAVGISTTPNYVRLVYGGVLSAKEREFVQAARSVGSPRTRILLQHILPNIFAPVIVLATLGVAWAILTGATLSFLGLGAQPPTSEWGTMVANGQEYLRYYWWISVFPGLAIMLTVLGINLFGDGLRDVLDPRLIL